MVLTTLGHGGPATFDVWHDGLAGRLRCSTRSLPRERLPFEATTELGVPLEAVVAELLAEAHPGRMPWDELTPVPFDGAGTGWANDVVVQGWTADVAPWWRQRCGRRRRCGSAPAPNAPFRRTVMGRKYPLHAGLRRRFRA